MINYESVHAHLHVVYVHWGFLLTLQTMNKPKTTNEVNQTKISKVQEYISRHYRDELPLSKLAEVASLAPTSLCHIYKAHTGSCLSQYINAVRIQHAKELLLSTDCSIKVVAFECGYSTLTNFNRQFLRHAGSTPTAWREKNIKDESYK